MNQQKNNDRFGFDAEIKHIGESPQQDAAEVSMNSRKSKWLAMDLRHRRKITPEKLVTQADGGLFKPVERFGCVINEFRAKAEGVIHRRFASRRRNSSMVMAESGEFK